MVVNKVFKIGRSWTVAIPRGFFEKLGALPGDYMKVKLNERAIVITPLEVVKVKEKKRR